VLSLIEIPWYFAVVMVAWFILGDPKPTPYQSEVLEATAVLPTAAGAIIGISAILWLIVKRRIIIPRTWIFSILVAILGLAACCVAFTFAGYGIVNG
jgi:hypothetical protein